MNILHDISLVCARTICLRKAVDVGEHKLTVIICTQASTNYSCEFKRTHNTCNRLITMSLSSIGIKIAKNFQRTQLSLFNVVLTSS